MDIEFLKQRTPGEIRVLDRIDLRNCEDSRKDGLYVVGDIDPITGDITLVGVGRKTGCVIVICEIEPNGVAA